jgi:hypothetical protein
MANPLWGASRIYGEFLKLGIEVSQSTVAKYMVRQRKPSSQTWRAFLNNHVNNLVSTDFFINYRRERQLRRRPYPSGWRPPLTARVRLRSSCL